MSVITTIHREYCSTGPISQSKYRISPELLGGNTKHIILARNSNLKTQQGENHFTFRGTSCCPSFVAASMVLESGSPQVFLFE